jgi:hypothetical protein
MLPGVVEGVEFAAVDSDQFGAEGVQPAAEQAEVLEPRFESGAVVFAAVGNGFDVRSV